MGESEERGFDGAMCHSVGRICFSSCYKYALVPPFGSSDHKLLHFPAYFSSRPSYNARICQQSRVIRSCHSTSQGPRMSTSQEKPEKEAVILAASVQELVQQQQQQQQNQQYTIDNGDDFKEDDDHIDISAFYTTLDTLLEDAGILPVQVHGKRSVVITGIQSDSRLIAPGNLFVCCEGLRTDGHLYASQAAQRGAAAILVSKEALVYMNEAVEAVVVVEDTNAILSGLSAAFYHHPSKKLSVVGITGTNGKTTTSFLLKHMFEAVGHKVGLLGTIAYHIGGKKAMEATKTTPDALSLQKLMATMVHNGTEVCVMEASSHGLALDRCKQVYFDIAVFTNLTRDHMDFHKTVEHYKESKGRLFAKMVDPQQHRKIVNMDDCHASYFAGQGSTDVPVVGFSLQNRNADVYAVEINLSLVKTDVLVHTPKGRAHISSMLLGRHNVSNILAAVAVGIAVDAPLKQIIQGIEQVRAVPGRFELIQEGQSFAVLVDYAHTPDALSRLLDTVRECGARRVITVVGCGGDRDKGKRPIMAKFAADKSDICLLTSDNPRTEKPSCILNDMLAGLGMSIGEYESYESYNRKERLSLQNGCGLLVCEDRSRAIRTAIEMGRNEDAIVVAGKGHETYQIIGDRVTYFDDRAQCREALKALYSPSHN